MMMMIITGIWKVPNIDIEIETVDQ
jgi:hypothetical protein